MTPGGLRKPVFSLSDHGPFWGDFSWQEFWNFKKSVKTMGFLIIFPRVGIKDRHISGFETSPSPFQINFPMPNTSSAVVGGTRAAAVERRHCRDLYGAVGGWAKGKANGKWGLVLKCFKEKMMTNHRILVLHHFIKPKCYHNADSQGISRPNIGITIENDGFTRPPT